MEPDHHLIQACGLYADKAGNLHARTGPGVVISHFPGLPYPWMAHPKRRKNGPPRATLVEAMADLLTWGDVPALLRAFRISGKEGQPLHDNRRTIGQESAP